jgi:hypothetical protein
VATFKKVGLVASIMATSLVARSEADLYTQPLSIADTFVTNPYFVSNAVIYQESGGPSVRYWGPTTPNVEGIVTLKFEVPFTIQTASIAAGVTAYTLGSDANFDPNAATYLDISTDNLTWTTVASQTNQNAVHSGIAGPWDISSIVAGSNIVYARARMFMTTNFSFSPSQFMRQGAPYVDPVYFTASSVPEAGSYVFAFIAAISGGCCHLLSKRAKRVALRRRAC